MWKHLFDSNVRVDLSFNQSLWIKVRVGLQSIIDIPTLLLFRQTSVYWVLYVDGSKQIAE